jgi:MazG family protein
MSLKEFERLNEVVTKLRDPENGCPWDLEQTHRTLLKYLMEESYEFMHAVEDDNYDHMEDELGDVLLQVVLHSVIAKQAGKFDIESVSKRIADKMVRRHPHVFGDVETKDVGEIKKNWEEIKQQEKADKEVKYEIDNDLLAFPSLTSAAKIGKKTGKINFDWDGPSQVVYKVEEEWQELKEELAPYPNYNHERVKEELGDFLFSIAQLARHLKIDPEIALRDANLKFKQRFNQVEDLAKDKGIALRDSSQSELEELWQEVKYREKNS